MNKIDNQINSQTNRSRKGKWILALIVLLLVGPFIIVPLFIDPFSISRKAHGVLVDPPVAIGDINVHITETPTTIGTIDHNWKLFYIMPRQCLKACENSILQMERVYRSMDRMMDRVTPLVVYAQTFPKGWQERASQEFSEITFAAMHIKELLQLKPRLNDLLYKNLNQDTITDKKSSLKIVGSLNEGFMYLLSPDGHIVVYYPPIEDEHEAILKARGIRSDLRKSIKGTRD